MVKLPEIYLHQVRSQSLSSLVPLCNELSEIESYEPIASYDNCFVVR